MAPQNLPVSVFLAICNEVIEDSVTRNKTLVSLFDRIGVPGFPAVHQRTGVLVSLQGAVGDIAVTISIKSPDGTALVSLDGKAHNSDPSQSVDFAMNVAGLQLPEAGHYTLEVSSGGELLAQRTFRVIPISDLGLEFKAALT